MQVGTRVTRARSKINKSVNDNRGKRENIREYLIQTRSSVTKSARSGEHIKSPDVITSPINIVQAETGNTTRLKKANSPHSPPVVNMPLDKPNTPQRTGNSRGSKPNNPATPIVGGTHPNKPPSPRDTGKGTEEVVTLSSLAKMIKDSHTQLKTQIKDLTTNFTDFQNDFSEWQSKTDERLGGLEESTQKHYTAIKSHKRTIIKVDAANENLMHEMRELRLENKKYREQLITTQTVLRKVNAASNLYGRCLKQRNIRLGRIASPILPEIRGAAGGERQREDTKHVVAEWIVKNELYPGKDINGMKEIIDVAYRTGKPVMNRVRNILVVFNRISDRNIVMRAGKIKEREKKLGGAYLMDDLTSEDYSLKERCHGIMKEFKDQEKKPMFMYGTLKNKEGTVTTKTVKEFNKNKGIVDKRSKEITVDNLTMHLVPKRKKKKNEEIQPIIEIDDEDELIIGGDSDDETSGESEEENEEQEATGEEGENENKE